MSYLQNSREKSLTDDSNVSEAELHATQPGIRESWEEIQALKKRIAIAKQEASAKVDAEFAEELKSAEDAYALVMHMSR
jgi:hypothetical protein